MLSIHPLIENAVKHGVAARSGAGFVRLTIRRESDTISVVISNSGAGDVGRMTETNGGIGLANVRRRLALCYGEETQVEVSVVEDITSVGFTLPLRHPSETPAAV